MPQGRARPSRYKSSQRVLNAGGSGIPFGCQGDLSGLADAGSETFKLHQAFQDRADTIGFDDYEYASAPVTFWDLFGEQGHPIRTTVSEMGPLLLSRLMELTEAQEGI